MVFEKGKFSLWTASAFVVANMVGTGVFTSLGFQLLTTENFIAIIILWLVGGVIALCGSLVYGEIGATLPGSGGEYHYMNGIYGPFAGFIAGYIQSGSYASALRLGAACGNATAFSEGLADAGLIREMYNKLK